MVPLYSLWLPILVSAVVVFIASALMHMLLTYHHSDYKQIPNEGNVLAAMRTAGLQPGNYHFPFGGHKEMKSPAMVEKFKQGPVGLLSVLPSGPPAMQKFLSQWFAFCLLISIFAAYLTGSTVAPGASYLAAFRVAGTAAFLAYGVGLISNGIWKGQSWSMTIKEVIDGLVYALLTAGVFGLMWHHR